MLKGQLRADGLVIAAFQVSFLNQAGVEIKAEAKLVDNKTGRTHATAHVVAWTPEVMTKLRELVDAMERAAGQVLFSEMEEGGALPEKPGLKVRAEAGGLDTFLSGEAIPQV